VNVWVDDERDPAQHGHAGWLWLKSGEEAVVWLFTVDMAAIENLSLDHDMGPGRTGYDVLTWIERRVADGATPPRHIYIHTQNPVGRERMRAARASIYRIAARRGGS
jgi:hypothetical protein